MSYVRWVLLPALLGALLGGAHLGRSVSDPYVRIHVETKYDPNNAFVVERGQLGAQAPCPPDDRALEQWLKSQPGVVECAVRRDPANRLLTISYALEGFHPEPDLREKVHDLGYGYDNQRTTRRFGRDPAQDADLLDWVAPSLPSLALSLSGCVLALRNLRRHPLTSLGVLAALGGMELLIGLQFLWRRQIDQLIAFSFDDPSSIHRLVGFQVLLASLHALLVGLLAVLVVTGRDPSPPT